MRVVSFVPSWTETLLASGVNVVGRSRFCIHPEGAKAIPAVGGTKNFKMEALEELKPDLVILDKEENTPEMADSRGWKVHCSQVKRTDDVPEELDRLAAILGNSTLGKLAEDWRIQLASPTYPKEKVAALPGVIDWLKEPETEPEQIVYLIWRSPWMAISRDTFIGNMLSQVGYGGRLPHFQDRYPKVDLGSFDPAKTLLLFSSEPYPFAEKRRELLALDFPSALVDGEAYSWFGLRSLRFLQSQEK